MLRNKPARSRSVVKALAELKRGFSFSSIQYVPLEKSHLGALEFFKSLKQEAEHPLDVCIERITP